MDNMIQTEHLDFAYQLEGAIGVPILRDVNVSIGQGEFLAVLGHNGSGKSTLAKHFNSILLPLGGKVYVCGMDTADEDKVFEIRQNVGMVFQNPDNQIVATIVEEDVAFALENMGVPPAEIRERVDSALRAVGMYEYREHAPHRLSGGQKQRVAIAGIIAMRPKCVVLDEPTAMLDPQGRREVLATLHALRREYGITVVLITHYMEEAAQADRVIVMDDGQVMMQGTPREVFRHVDELREAGLDTPQATELAHLLIADGFALPDDLLTEEEFVEAFLMCLQRAGS